MPSCVLRYCTNYSTKVNKVDTRTDENVTFHRLPRIDNEKREEWIKFVRKDRSEQTWLPSKFSTICSLHFMKDDIHISTVGRKFLKKSAVPILENTDISCNSPRPDSPLSVDSSESINNSILISPREIFLTNKLKRIQSDNQTLRRKLKKSQRQIKALQKRKESMKKIINELKQTIISIVKPQKNDS